MNESLAISVWIDAKGLKVFVARCYEEAQEAWHAGWFLIGIFGRN